MLFYIFLAAFLLWAVISPLYPDKATVPRVPRTPEEIEATRLQLEAFQQSIDILLNFLWPLAVCLFLFLVCCFFLKRFRP